MTQLLHIFPHAAIRKTLTIFLMLCCCAAVFAEREYGDSALYQGLNIKLDVGQTVYTLARSHADRQQYEVAVNANLRNKYYPTVELGYGLSHDVAGGGTYNGQGAFTRIGIDINPLRKGQSRDYALLAGLRFGLALQDFSLTGVTLHDDYWSAGGVIRDYPPTFRADAWGEAVAGLQIKVAGPITMGWFARIHFLFTGRVGDHQPYYIPGFGCVDAGNFTFNYYVGFRL